MGFTPQWETGWYFLRPREKGQKEGRKMVLGSLRTSARCHHLVKPIYTENLNLLSLLTLHLSRALCLLRFTFVSPSEEVQIVSIHLPSFACSKLRLCSARLIAASPIASPDLLMEHLATYILHASAEASCRRSKSHFLDFWVEQSRLSHRLAPEQDHSRLRYLPVHFSAVGNGGRF